MTTTTPDTMLSAWSALERWLRDHAPEALSALRPPADAATIAAAEHALGLSLPADYRAWLALHDGAEESGPIPGELLALRGVVSTWRLLNDLEARGSFRGAPVDAGPGVRATWWSARWVPISSDGAGNHLCLDLAPAAGGAAGQLVEFWHDHGARRVHAASFTALLAQTLAQLESGALVVAEDDGRFVGVLRRASLTGTLATLRVRGESETQWRARARAAVRTAPRALAYRLVQLLARYGALQWTFDAAAGTPLVLADAAQAIAPLLPADLDAPLAPAVARAVHDRLARCEGVAQLSWAPDALARALDAIPFEREVLGAPPPPPRRPVAAPVEDLSDEPLEQLVDALDDTGQPPLDWVVEHAPDGDLEPLWRACARPRPLLLLAAARCDARALAGAACAVLRALRTDAERGLEPGLPDALERVEAWLRGASDLAPLEALAASTPRQSVAAWLLGVPLARDAGQAARRAATFVASLGLSDDDPRAAETIRQHLACPTLAQLLASR